LRKRVPKTNDFGGEQGEELGQGGRGGGGKKNLPVGEG